MYERQDVQKYLASRVARPSSAGVIVENTNGDALILKANYKQYWSFPGGWVEDDQTPPEAAARELFEETALVCDASALEFVFVIDRISELMQTYQFIFRAPQPVADEPAITLQASEIDEWRFVDRATVLADPDIYGLAVVMWAQGDTRGYAEQRVDIS